MPQAQSKFDVESIIRVDTKKKKRVQSIYLNWAEKVVLMKECGDAAVILLEFYMSKAGMPGYVYTDQKSATALKWTVAKVRFVRGKLQKAGYYCMKSVRHVRSRKRILIFYIGKDAVLTHKNEKLTVTIT